MASEKVEIPSGFTCRELTAIKSRIPMPQGWFFNEELHGKVKSYNLTREPITSLGVEGFFTTGLSIWVTPRINENMGRPPSEVAKKFVAKNKDMTSIGDYEIKQDGQLLVCRRHFTVGRRFLVGGRIIEPMTIYGEATGNDLTGTLFLMIFESPTKKWNEDAEIGRKMIENRVLSEEI